VIVDLSQAWTTDWMSESGKHKLQQYGIAPPQGQSHSCGTHVALTDGITCPQCLSNNSKLLSEFGSTACKCYSICSDTQEDMSIAIKKIDQGQFSTWANT
ncbi:PaaD-like zinc ribbon domain-containing protein, partial [Klebsiella pneumoniae]|uniref:PaaD-like zinc ribbon domain-containing protein n=1 Tax=Klebsiella pneumoniae TaxID=573 RepID=UPI0040389FD9